MGNNSAEQLFPRTTRSHGRAMGDSTRRRARMPSSTGYMLAAIAAAIALFFALWWMLVSGGDEAPWVPAGLAASVVLLVALSAREVIMRRAWTRYLLEQDAPNHSARTSGRSNSSRKAFSTSMATALRTIQKMSAEANASSLPELHLDLFHLCQNYLASAEEALRSNNLLPEKRIAIRSGQERVRVLEKHHLLTWAKDASRAFTHEAQQRARMSDQIEAANRAIDCLETALRVFPEDAELNASRSAIRELIGSIKVAHWVEIAERNAFKGNYRRAIERYQDALFYLERETVKDDVRIAGVERINREIELLRARISSSNKPYDDVLPTEEEQERGSAN